MCECKLILFGAFVVCNVILVIGFNIDTLNYAVYKKKERSMFGFTVAVHMDRTRRGWVLVGAPEAQSIYQDPNVVVQGGAVYKCRPDGDDVCQEIPFDRQSNVRYGNTVLDEKSRQWFGATLSSSGQQSGPVVACAPRYVWFTKHLNRKDPVGTCFVANGAFDHFEEYSPCRTMNWGYHRQGSCQAGFSAAINKEGDRLYVGAPGTYYWQGQMYSIDAHATFNYTPGFFGNLGYGAKGSVHQQSLENRPAVFSTREGKPPDDDSYIGYSTVVGHFLRGEEYEGVAVGMPRGNKLRGKILLFTWNLVNYKNITTSKQIGSYFGYSITAADVNGDKLLDIIVGAPMHTEPNNKAKYDVGRVYVFYQNSKFSESFNSSDFIDGTNSKSRFGHSVATLGDLNQDGYEDFAVGAPYDGPRGYGAVYIYYGSQKGVHKKYGQVIYAEDVQTSVGLLTTFGFSVAGGMDLDENEYPDMAVGAYLSDAVFFFRARPVALIEGFVRFETKNKQIDIKQKNCKLPNGDNGTCTAIDFCIQYNGNNIPDQLYLTVQYILDTKKPNIPRMGFFNHGTHTFNDTVLLRKGSRDYCRNERVYVKNDIRDKLTPLEAEVRYFMMDSYSSHSGTTRNPRSQLTPVIDLNSPPSRKDSIIIQKNCGLDNVCIPNLQVNITSNVEKYLLGSNGNLSFDVIISNLGEDSFETTFKMEYPEGIFYNSVSTKPGITKVLCSDFNLTKTLLCDIGNPLPGGKISTFTVFLQPYHKEGMPPSYEFDVYVNSTNPEDETTTRDNHRHVSIRIWVDASLELRGESYPPTVYYNESRYGTKEIVRESELGPQVTHVYYLTNIGPATIQEAEIFILWPSVTLGGEDLLYLLDQPHKQGNVKCDAARSNYKHYELDYYRNSIWERLKIDTSNFESTHTQKFAATKNTEVGKGVSSGEGVVNKNVIRDNDITNSSGDSSNILDRRHNISSNSAYWNLKSGEYVHTEARYVKTYVDGVPHITWKNITTVRDAQGKILRTLSADNNEKSAANTDGLVSGENKGNRYDNGSDSFGHLNGNGEYIHSESRYTTSYVNGVPHTIWENVTTIRDGQGNILNTIFSTDNSKQSVAQVGGGQVNAGRQQNFEGQEEELHPAEKRRQQAATAEQNTQENRYQSRFEERRQEQNYQQPVHYPSSEEEWRRYQASGQNHHGAGSDNQESRFYEQKTYEVGGGSREGGRIDSSVPNEGNGRTSFAFDQKSSRDSQIYSGNGHVLSGYYDEQGVYRDLPRDSLGRVIYNRTYISEGSTSIPIDISGSGSIHRGLDETALGSGFTVQTLDLGNAKSEDDLSSSLSRGSSYGQSSKGSSGSSDGFRQEVYRQGHTSVEGNPSNTEYRSEWHSQDSWSNSGQIPPTFIHNSVEKDNVPTDAPNPRSSYRGKRMIEEDPYARIQALVECNSANCSYIRCVVGTLDKDKEIAIALRSRLNIRVVKDLTSSQSMKLSSMMVAQISKLPYIGVSKEQTLRKHEIFTEVPTKESELVPEVAPMWIYVVSAVAGIIMLLLLIWILSKCGFFKRNRPSSAPERQPLNRNGYHGDEAL